MEVNISLDQLFYIYKSKQERIEAILGDLRKRREVLMNDLHLQDEKFKQTVIDKATFKQEARESLKNKLVPAKFFHGQQHSLDKFEEFFKKIEETRSQILSNIQNLDNEIQSNTDELKYLIIKQEKYLFCTENLITHCM